MFRVLREMAERDRQVIKVQDIVDPASRYRLKEWLYFSQKVHNHVDVYTIPQYGDYPDDQVTEWSAQRCVDEIKRYCARFGSNARGEKETLRDLLKIAHYACLAHSKLRDTAK